MLNLYNTPDFYSPLRLSHFATYLPLSGSVLLTSTPQFFPFLWLSFIVSQNLTTDTLPFLCFHFQLNISKMIQTQQNQKAVFHPIQTISCPISPEHFKGSDSPSPQEENFTLLINNCSSSCIPYFNN